MSLLSFAPFKFAGIRASRDKSGGGLSSWLVRLISRVAPVSLLRAFSSSLRSNRAAASSRVSVVIFGVRSCRLERTTTWNDSPTLNSVPMVIGRQG